MLGSSFASSRSAPCAWEIERISIQWPSSMMVTSVASSSHSGMPGYPNVTAALKTNATVMASAISVIIPGSRSRSSRQAPWRNGQPAVQEHCRPEERGDPPMAGNRRRGVAEHAGAACGPR